MPKRTSKPLSVASLASLAAAISPSRLGTTSPLAAAPLAGAPGERQTHDRPTDVGRLRRSLRACTAEGLMAEVVTACAGGAILTAWAIHLHASALVTGALLALSQFAQLFQIPAAWTTSWLGRRRACILLVGLSRLIMLPLAALPFMPVSDAARQAILLGIAGISAVLGVLGNNAWVAWMGELVPKRVRGRYFGQRTAVCTLGGALSAAAAGALMDEAGGRALTGLALSSLQVLACVCGLVATALMFRQHDTVEAQPPAKLSLARLSTPLRDPAFRGLIVYLASWNAAVGLAGSYFALHMLRNLGMSFTWVALHGTAVALVRMIAAPIWGGLLDRLGARPVLYFCSYGISAIPFIWLLPTADSLWPLLLDCLVAGVLWCGHSLATFHLPLSITPRAERPFYLAVLATVSGLAFSLATIAGGLIAELVPDRFVLGGRSFCDLHVLFVISGGLRLAAAALTQHIREPSAYGLEAVWEAMLGKISPRRATARLSK